MSFFIFFKHRSYTGNKNNNTHYMLSLSLTGRVVWPGGRFIQGAFDRGGKKQGTSDRGGAFDRTPTIILRHTSQLVSLASIVAYAVSCSSESIGNHISRNRNASEISYRGLPLLLLFIYQVQSIVFRLWGDESWLDYCCE